MVAELLDGKAISKQIQAELAQEVAEFVGTGAVVRYMFRIGGIDLAIVGACTLLYLLRRPREQTPPLHSLDASQSS